MTKFKLKLLQVPLGGKFVLNGLVFTRCEFVESKDAYRCSCDSKKLTVWLHRYTNVEPMQELL